MTTTENVPAHVPPHLVFDFDIYADPRVTEDLHESYAAALCKAPDIFYSPSYGGFWVVRRIAAMTEICKDSACFSSREAQIPRVANPPFMIPFSVDPPDHGPYRQALMPWFSAKAVEKMEARMRRWAIQFVDEVADTGECDFITDVSGRFPVSVFMELMGMPFDRLDEFRSIVGDYFKSVTSEDYERLSGRIAAIMTVLMDIRRNEPGDDLVSHMLTVKINGRNLTREEILAICHVMFLGGMDTVTNVLGFAFRALANDTVLQQRLSNNPALVPNFVEEALRCFGTASSVRIVTKDCERMGISFRKDEMILCALPISGRDDREHANPDRFDIDRPNAKSHLTFSSGPHLCIGHLLARAEIRILTEEWIKRIPSFSAVPCVRHGFRMGLVHAMGKLPLRWDMAT